MEYYLVLLLRLPQGFVMMLAESVHMPTRGLYTLADAIVVQSSEELVRCPPVATYGVPWRTAPYDACEAPSWTALWPPPYQHVFAGVGEPQRGSCIWNKNIEDIERFGPDCTL